MHMHTLVFSALWARGVIVNPAVDDTFIPPAAGGVNLWLHLQAGTPPGHTIGLSWCYKSGPEEALELTQGQAPLRNRNLGVFRVNERPGQLCLGRPKD